MNPIAKSFPPLSVREINDVWVQKNFRALQDFFASQNQLLNFNFIEFNFTAAVTNQKIAHGLGIIPQDAIITRITGSGIATLNWALFDNQNVDVTTTGQCRIRMFVGSYWNSQTALGNSASDAQAINGAANSTPTTSVVNITTTGSNPTGTILCFAGATAPAGYIMCDGGAYDRGVYASLYAVIGTTYGVGDGSSTFNSPDLRGRIAVGKDDMGGTPANRVDSAGSGVDGKTLGANGGSQNVAITTAQLPAHSHGILGGLTGSTLPINNAATSAFCGLSSSSLTYFNTAPSGGNQFIQNTGSGTAHNNVQPTLVVNYIIKT